MGFFKISVVIDFFGMNFFLLNHAEGVIFPLGMIEHVSEPETPRSIGISQQRIRAQYDDDYYHYFPCRHLFVCVVAYLLTMLLPITYHHSPRQGFLV